jgi:hypothetical protein
MRKLKIIEHISLDGVVQHSNDDNDFPYSDWTFDQVYAEMKDYDFYTSNGHGGFKDYLEAYWTRIQSEGYPDMLGVFGTNAANVASATTVTTSTPRQK